MACKSAYFAILVACLLAGSCTRGPDYNDEQKEVLAATEAWVRAVNDEDTGAMWALLSKSAQLYFEIELTGPRGMRSKVRNLKAAIRPDSLISDAQRKRGEDKLKTYPEDPDNLTPEQYYAWRRRNEFTPEQKDKTARLLAPSNIRELNISKGKATIILKHGDPSKYVWVLEEKEWKFDLKPAVSRLLERSLEGRGRGD